MNKIIFDTQEQTNTQEFHPRQEFDSDEVVIEEAPREVEAELIVEESLNPPRWWGRLFLAGCALLGVAVLAQSIQWLIDTWQQHQWIYFVFAVAFLGISLAGIGAILAEWRLILKLRKHQQNQNDSKGLLEDVSTASGQKSAEFCNTILKDMPDNQMMVQRAQKWQSELNEAYSGKEVLFLFSENVLKPVDAQVKRLISKNAVENALIVAISPLALVDVLFIAWRNIALVNKISRLYGMKLGYVSRLKLFKLVITNMAFAGVSEIATDLGGEFFSQNLTAKLSMRAAQGIGVGLLTARLGIKAMEFCRPIIFQTAERPKLSVIRQELLSALSEQIFSTSNEKEKVKR